MGTTMMQAYWLAAPCIGFFWGRADSIFDDLGQPDSIRDRRLQPAQPASLSGWIGLDWIGFSRQANYVARHYTWLARLAESSGNQPDKAATSQVAHSKLNGRDALLFWAFTSLARSLARSLALGLTARGSTSCITRSLTLAYLMPLPVPILCHLAITYLPKPLADAPDWTGRRATHAKGSEWTEYQRHGRLAVQALRSRYWRGFGPGRLDSRSVQVGLYSSYVASYAI